MYKLATIPLLACGVLYSAASAGAAAGEWRQAGHYRGMCGGGATGMTSTGTRESQAVNRRIIGRRCSSSLRIAQQRPAIRRHCCLVICVPAHAMHSLMRSASVLAGCTLPVKSPGASRRLPLSAAEWAAHASPHSGICPDSVHNPSSSRTARRTARGGPSDEPRARHAHAWNARGRVKSRQTQDCFDV